MLIASLLLFRLKGTVSALCGIVLFSYLSFFALYYTPYSGDFYTALDSIRVGLVMVLIMHCGLKSDRPKVYLAYALILAIHLVTNCFSIVIDGFAAYSDYSYLVITIFEILIFCIGANRTLKIKSRKDDVALHFGSIGSINNYWSRPSGSLEATSKGARK